MVDSLLRLPLSFFGDWNQTEDSYQGAVDSGAKLSKLLGELRPLGVLDIGPSLVGSIPRGHDLLDKLSSVLVVRIEPCDLGLLTKLHEERLVRYPEGDVVGLWESGHLDRLPNKRTAAYDANMAAAMACEHSVGYTYTGEYAMPAS